MLATVLTIRCLPPLLLQRSLRRAPPPPRTQAAAAVRAVAAVHFRSSAITTVPKRRRLTQRLEAMVGREKVRELLKDKGHGLVCDPKVRAPCVESKGERERDCRCVCHNATDHSVAVFVCLFPHFPNTLFMTYIHQRGLLFFHLSKTNTQARPSVVPAVTMVGDGINSTRKRGPRASSSTALPRLSIGANLPRPPPPPPPRSRNERRSSWTFRSTRNP